MGGKAVDHTSARFGLWTVISRAPNSDKGRVRWECRCECGTKKIVPVDALTQGKSRSCGCMSNEWRTKTKHGHTSGRGRPSGTYSSWHAMRQRCQNENTGQFSDYGGRGIVVCDRWNDFANFLADMGERPAGMTLDRVDPNGNYEPGNCKWATRKQQSANQRAKIRNGDVIPLLAAARSVVSASAPEVPGAVLRLKDAIDIFELRRAA